MPGPYEGAHGFVFLHEDDATPPADVIATLLRYLDRNDGPVFFAALFEGDFAGFAHLAADDLPGLVEFIGTVLFDAGVRSDLVTEGLVHTDAAAVPMGPKRKSPRFCAICRVRTNARPKVVLAEIDKAFGGRRPLVGASRVIGGFPLLVELGSNDEDVLSNAIERLRNVPGVDDVRVATTDTGPGEDDSGHEEEQASGA